LQGRLKEGKYRSKIGIIGLGKLGLPLSLAFAKAGFEVYGIDARVVIEHLNRARKTINFERELLATRGLLSLDTRLKT